MKNDPRIGMELRALLSRTYNLKAIADYETGDARVTTEQALEAIQTAARLVEIVSGLLPPNGLTSQAPDAPTPHG